jgi:uncharacterized Tic20 family protein
VLRGPRAHALQYDQEVTDACVRQRCNNTTNTTITVTISTIIIIINVIVTISIVIITISIRERGDGGVAG